MHSRGWSLAWLQSDTKYKSLKRKYKLIKDHNNRSSSDRRTWEYFDVSLSFLTDKLCILLFLNIIRKLQIMRKFLVYVEFIIVLYIVQCCHCCHQTITKFTDAFNACLEIQWLRAWQLIFFQLRTLHKHGIHCIAYFISYLLFHSLSYFTICYRCSTGCHEK